MKKCPLTYNNSNEKGAYSDCIGKECAAYIKSPEIYSSVEHNGITHLGEVLKYHWRCGAIPSEVWHDVEETK